MTTTASDDFTTIPGPAPLPVFGWLPAIAAFAFDPLAALQNLRKKYGSLIRLGYGKKPAIMIFDPAYNHQILRDPSVFYSYSTEMAPAPFLKESAFAHLTTGLPFANGERHKDQRAYLLPYFHRKFVTCYHDACLEITEKHLSAWQVGREIDLRAEMEQLAVRLMARPVLGLDPDKEGEQIRRQLDRTLSILFSPLALLFPYDVPGLPFHRLLRHANEMEMIIRKVIALKKAEGLGGQDLLSVMIRLHEQEPERLSEAELIGNTVTMFRGGYNPNGMALYWTIFLLSQHPEALQKVMDELERVLGGQPPTAEQLDDLPQLTGAINETMRLFPAGTWTARVSMQPFELGGYRLPEGTWIVISPFVTQRLPEVFPAPGKFLPERWLTIHPSAYEFMPFSGGPRYCIGAALSMMQLKIALAIILQRYRFMLKPGARVDCFGLNAIRPRKGLPMLLGDPAQRPVITNLRGNIHKIVEFA